jgi:methionyl-tRNA formyltransferase
MKKIAIFGCKSTTEFMIVNLSKQFKISQIITISPDLGDKHQVADYYNLQELADSLGIDIYVAKTYNLKNESDIKAINSMELDLAFVIGWQRLIPKEILDRFSIGIFGMHGSSMNLPLGRGRSPMNWSIIEDRKFFYTNLFQYDSGVDSGDVVDTFIFSINAYDTAETMHIKNMLAMKYLISRNHLRLLSNDFTLIKQLDKVPTYYPKRTPGDSIINWDEDIFFIERFIRAVTKPFNGAYSFVENSKLVIYRASIFETDIVSFGYEDRSIATIVEVFSSGKFIVKCNLGLLIVHDYLSSVTISPGMKFDNASQPIQYFDRNPLGYYDLPEST